MFNNPEVYIPLLSALAGAVIGASASILTILINSYYENKRHETQIAYSSAVEDLKTAYAAAEAVNRGGNVAPFECFLWHHMEFMKLTRKGKLTPESLKALKTEAEVLWPFHVNAQDK